MAANGTGKIEVRGNTNSGAVVLNCEANTHGITIQAPAHSAFGGSYTLTLPPNVEAGDANKVLKTDANGNLDWVAQTVNTNTNLGNTNITADGNRTYDQNGDDLTIDPNGGTFSVSDSSGAPSAAEIQVGGGSLSLMGLTFPSSDGSNGQVLTTNGSGTLSFAASGSGVTTFLALNDTPSSFTASKFLKVNSAGNAVELVDGSGSGISNVVEDTTPQLGGDLDTNGKNVLFAKTGNTNHASNGDIVKIGTGSTTQGELCYYTSSGTWAAADADATGTAGGVLLAIALGTDPDADGMLLRGMYTLDHDPGTIGDELYVSTTAGDITGTAPSGTGDIVRVVGYCLDSTNGQIWFNPSNDFIELA